MQIKKCLYRSPNRKVMVREELYHGMMARLLLVNETAESASFIDEEFRNTPPFDYMFEFDRALSQRIVCNDILILGGAGFTFPKFVLSHYSDISMDVVEIDPMMIKLAKEYFYLDDCLEKYGTDEDGNERMNVVIADANTYVRETKKKYDIVFHDAYTEDHIEQGLLSADGIRRVKNCLKSGGIYVVNFITALTGMQSMPGIMAREQLKQQFRYVTVLPCNDNIASNERQNAVFMASDGELAG